MHRVLQGLKTASFWYLFGTTEVMPCYKAAFLRLM